MPQNHVLDGAGTGDGVYTLCAVEFFAHSHEPVKNLRIYFAKIFISRMHIILLLLFNNYEVNVIKILHTA
jgi:hypothetical protein